MPETDEYDDWMSPEERFEWNILTHLEYARVKGIWAEAELTGNPVTMLDLFPTLEPYSTGTDFIIWGVDSFNLNTTPAYKRNKHKYGRG